MSNPTNFLNHRSYSIVKIEGDSFTIVRLTSMPTSASPKTRQGFDYTSLDPATSQFVQQQTGEIRALMKRTAQDIIELGQKLIAVKAKLGHGRFGDWLEAEFKWSVQTAKRFMNVAAGLQNQQFVDFMAPSALYEIFAPSTPEAAREEALARAASGESISHKAAKSIKQKYATPTPKQKHEPEPESKPELQPGSQSLSTPTSETLPQARLKQQIVAIIPPKQPSSGPEATNGLLPKSVSASLGIQPKLPVSTPDVPGIWWQLGRHLLYCGDPNSTEFLERIPEQLSLLFAFPSKPNWQPGMQANTRFIQETLAKEKDVRLFEDTLESILLLCSNLGEVVVSCYLPSPEIISIINRQSRRGLFAEPDSRRVAAIISDWKGAGFKVERLN